MISTQIKEKWRNILGREINEDKTFIENEASMEELTHLVGWIQGTFKVNVTFEEIMENTIEQQVRIIQSRPQTKEDNLQCITKQSKKSGELSFTQKELLNEYFFLLNYDYK